MTLSGNKNIIAQKQAINRDLERRNQMNVKSIVTINNTNVAIKEYCGTRVVTLREIDEVHQRSEGTARKRFNDNRQHFIEGTDFFTVDQPSEIRTLGLERPQGGVPESVTLITESGYLMLVKSFTDDLAWTVQRQLVNTYFRATEEQRRDAARMTNMEYLRIQSQALFELDDRVTELEDKVDNQMTIDHGQQRHLQRLVGERVYERAAMAFPPREVKANVGPFFKAIYKDLKNRFGVASYRDIKPMDYESAIDYVEAWIEPAECREQKEGKVSAWKS